MKGKTGSDRFTQIEENDPELFNFDYEVEPIVEVFLSILRPFLAKLCRLVEWSSIKKSSFAKNRKKKINIKEEDTQNWQKHKSWKLTKFVSRKNTIGASCSIEKLTSSRALLKRKLLEEFSQNNIYQI